jgi:hypothetical protein
MSVLKIALCDVRHATRGLHAHQLPLAIGLVGAYAKEYVKGASIELKLYRSAEKFLAEFRDWQPDIVGCSFYCWGRNLSLLLLDRVKAAFPDTLTVLGGPELEMEPELRQAFLRANAQVDNFNAIRRLLRENNIHVWDWLQMVGEVAPTRGDTVARHLAMFDKEAEDELYASPEAISAFAEENYEQLLSGERGDNLMNKYMMIANTDGFDDYLSLALEAARSLLLRKGVNLAEIDQKLGDLGSYIKMTYDFATYFHEPPVADVRNRVTFTYDIAAWLNLADTPLDEFAQTCSFDIWFSQDQVETINGMLTRGHDRSQTIQFIYRDRKFHVLLPKVERVEVGIPPRMVPSECRTQLPC